MLRADNGREFIAATLGEGLAECGVAQAFIEKGMPQQNAYVERFNGTMRDEVLNAQDLYRFGERYYDPQIGRWTQRDRVNQATDLRQANRYAYVGGDPINALDPNGTILCLIIRQCRETVYGPAYQSGRRYAGTLARRATYANGLACYWGRSTADGDTNSIQDDTVDAVNCLNPIRDITGELDGADGAG